MNVADLPGYFVIRDRIPFMLNLLYLLRGKVDPRILDSLSGLTILFTAFITGFTVLGYLYGYGQLGTLVEGWTYASPIEYGSFILLGFTYLLDKLDDVTLSANLCFLGASAGGWLYEIPLFIRKSKPVLRFNKLYTFYLSYQIIAVPLFLLLYKQTRHRETVWIKLAQALFMFYMISMLHPTLRFWFMNPVVGNWVARLPTLLLVGSYLYSVEGPR